MSESSQLSKSIRYVVRSPWQWVMDELIKETTTTTTKTTTTEKKTKDDKSISISIIPMTRVSSRQELPSSQLPDPPSSKSKKLRDAHLCLDLLQHEGDKTLRLVQSHHGISAALDGLEDKDELVRTFQRCRIDHLEYAPPSILLRWDTTLQECQNIIVNGTLPTLNSTTTEEIPTTVFAVLKEPLSKKGEGIHFVRNVQEIHTVLEQHRQTKGDDFLTEVMEQKGRIPMWILQAEIHPAMLIRDSKKFHIRTYVMAVETRTAESHEVNLYLYHGHEVRIAAEPTAPEDDLATPSRRREAHITNASSVQHRERVLLSQMDELNEYQPSLELFIASAFLRLLPDITRRVAVSAHECSEHIQKHVLGGVDCMMTASGKWYLLEVNKNPDTPSREDGLSQEFQHHLVTFCNDMQQLLTTSSEEGTQFVKLEDLIPKQK